MWFTFTNWRFLVPFAINQCGSALYVHLLGDAELATAVPVCNALTFVFTALTARALGEDADSGSGGRRMSTPRLLAGVGLVVLGTCLCVRSAGGGGR